MKRSAGTRTACLLSIATICSLVVGTPVLNAHAEDDRRIAKGIQDNSCLVEEAYNQEPGVVQHISCLRRQGHDWLFNFTQEWPIGSQHHQFSYSVPYSWLRSEGQRAQGVGDILLNYRYQALFEDATTPAFAPRLSLILPTGNAQRGLGSDSFGYQLFLPVSKIVADRVTLHGNVGVTSYVDVFGRRPTSYTLGGSGIYAVTREFNLMLELLGEWNESVNEMRQIERERVFTVSPGFRYALNAPEGQLVIGMGAPIQFSNGATDFGAFLYVSFEHSFSAR
jgi:hypothetical protein